MTQILDFPNCAKIGSKYLTLFEFIDSVKELAKVCCTEQKDIEQFVADKIKQYLKFKEIEQ